MEIVFIVAIYDRIFHGLVRLTCSDAENYKPTDAKLHVIFRME